MLVKTTMRSLAPPLSRTSPISDCSDEDKPQKTMKHFFKSVLVYFSLCFGPLHLTWASELEKLQPSVQQELKALSIIGGLPTPAFTWTLEKQRTSKGKRKLVEQFLSSANGLPVMITTEIRDSREIVKQRLSVRGLMDVDSKDTTLGLKLIDLVLPLKSGAKFSFELTRDHRTVTKQCLASERQEASSLHPLMSGLIIPITCIGSATYHGLNIKSTSELVWIESLNLFLALSEVAETPLGIFAESTRVLSFEFR